MTPYLLAAGTLVLGWAHGYLRGTRQHLAEHEQAEWVHELTASVPLLAIEAAPEPVVTEAGLPVRQPSDDFGAEFEVDDRTMARVLALLQAPESPLTAELTDPDYWAPIAASMGPLPVEPELVGVG